MQVGSYQSLLDELVNEEAGCYAGRHFDCEERLSNQHTFELCTAPNTAQSNSRRFGHRPRYNPRMPSVRAIVDSAFHAPVYWYPKLPELLDAFIPTTCIFLRSTSNGYVIVCDIDPARAPQSSLRGMEFLCSGGVMIIRRVSYAVKLMP